MTDLDAHRDDGFVYKILKLKRDYLTEREQHIFVKTPDFDFSALKVPYKDFIRKYEEKIENLTAENEFLKSALKPMKEKKEVDEEVEQKVEKLLEEPRRLMLQTMEKTMKTLEQNGRLEAAHKELEERVKELEENLKMSEDEELNDLVEMLDQIENEDDEDSIDSDEATPTRPPRQADAASERSSKFIPWTAKDLPAEDDEDGRSSTSTGYTDMPELVDPRFLDDEEDDDEDDEMPQPPVRPQPQVSDGIDELSDDLKKYMEIFNRPATQAPKQGPQGCKPRTESRPWFNPSGTQMYPMMNYHQLPPINRPVALPKKKGNSESQLTNPDRRASPRRCSLASPPLFTNSIRNAMRAPESRPGPNMTSMNAGPTTNAPMMPYQMILPTVISPPTYPYNRVNSYVPPPSSYYGMGMPPPTRGYYHQ